MDYVKRYKELYWEADGLFNQIMECSKMPGSEAMTLFCLMEGLNTQSAICKKLYMPKQTIHSAIKKLESQGLVVLADEKAKDKTKQIFITDKGKSVYMQNVHPLDAAENTAFAMLDVSEQEELIRITSKYNGFLKNVTEEYLKEHGKN